MSLLRLSSPALTAIAMAPLLVIALDMHVLKLPLDGLALHAVRFACIAWVFVFTMLAWRRLDEPAKEAHKFAWFWGGGGLMVLLVACMIPGAPELAAARVEDFLARNPDSPWSPASLGFLSGVMAAALAQAAGWAIVWCAWWAARRR